MKKGDQKIADELISYNLSLIKYGNKTVREVLTLLGKLEKNILKELEGDVAEWKKSRLNKTLKEIGDTTTSYYSDIAKTVDTDLLEIPAVAQKSFEKAATNTVAGEFTALASPARLEAIAKSTLIQGATNSSWWKKQDNDTKFKVQNIIRQGHAQGIGPKVIAKDVKTVLGVSKRHAETLVRTSVMTVNNEALQTIYENNSDAIEKVEHLSTLDSRTCLVCSNLDGKTYRLDQDKPSLPIHHNCRCVYTIITKTWKQLGIDIKELPLARRDMDNIVEGDTSFEGFIKRKGNKFKEDFFGKKRFEMYEAGKITISDMVNNRNRILTLEELKAL